MYISRERFVTFVRGKNEIKEVDDKVDSPNNIDDDKENNGGNQCTYSEESHITK